jgi:hypothetical protein
MQGHVSRFARSGDDHGTRHKRTTPLRYDPCSDAEGGCSSLMSVPATPPTMLPGYDTRLPREASHAEVARLIGEMLSRETGHRAQQVQITPIEEGTGYKFVATEAGPA